MKALLALEVLKDNSNSPLPLSTLKSTALSPINSLVNLA
jgi:hypothetical protein